MAISSMEEAAIYCSNNYRHSSVTGYFLLSTLLHTAHFESKTQLVTSLCMYKAAKHSLFIIKIVTFHWRFPNIS